MGQRARSKSLGQTCASVQDAAQAKEVAHGQPRGMLRRRWRGGAPQRRGSDPWCPSPGTRIVSFTGCQPFRNGGPLFLSLTPPAHLATLEDLGLTSALDLPVSPSLCFWTDEVSSCVRTNPHAAQEMEYDCVFTHLGRFAHC